MGFFDFVKNKWRISKEKYAAHKAMKEKLKNSEDEYRDLAPIDKIPNGNEYLTALHWAIKNKRVKNIALTGPYGSGKSSIVNSYLKRHPIIKFTHLRVSMATFVENVTDENGNKKKISFSSDQIEEGILKQLFYKVNHHKIPQSRYRKLHKVSYWSILGILLGIFLLFALGAFVFFPEQLDSVIQMITDAGIKVGLTKMYSLVIAGVFLFAMALVLACVWRQIQSRFKLKEIKVRDTTVKSETNDKESIFNKNMDEIIYFFEETKYRVVFFEDLDRLEASKIFVQLRELNTLLNNCDTIKRPIVFVYAVKDDIFTEEDRTKFFDFIIPVIPVINSTNSGEILLNLLRSDEDGTFKHDVSQDYVLDVAPFISDMRVLQNIYNEFLIYKRTLRTGQDLKLSDKLMMSLIIFKNLYPRDFADLQMEKGIVKKAFEDKKAYIVLTQTNLQANIDRSVQLIEKVQSDVLKSSNEMKVAMMGRLTGWNGYVKYIEQNYGSRYTAKEMMDAEFDFSIFYAKDHWRVVYWNWETDGVSSIYPEDLIDICKEYSERLNYLKEIERKRRSHIQKEIEFNKQRKYTVSSWSIKRLIENYGAEEVLSTEVRDNKLLVFMLRKGYIDEKYADYINYFKGSSITKDDMNFILGIKNHEAQMFEYSLSKIPQVLQRLQLHEFEQKEIYNFDLLEEMLASTEYEDKLHVMIKQLSDGSEASWKFIDEFIEHTKHQVRFVELISSNWNGMWTHIYNDPILSDERKVFYLTQLCASANVETLVALNYNQLITTFIEDREDILQQLSDIEAERMIKIISALNISFSKLEVKNVESKVLEFVFENRHYKINADMIRSVVAFKNMSLCDRLESQNYTVVTTLNYKSLIEYVHDTMEDYIDDIILSGKNTKEGIPQIIDLIQRNISDVERCKRIVQHEIFCLEDISVFCSDLIDSHKTEINKIWSLLFLQDKVSATWENIFTFWKHFGLTSTLEKFISKYVDVLKESDSRCVDDEEFKEAIIQSDIQSADFKKILSHVSLSSFDVPLANITPENVSVMITEHFLEYTSEWYEELAECYPHLCEEYILKNQGCFLKLMEETAISQDVFEKLVSGDETDRSFKQKVIDFCGCSLMTENVARQICLLELSIGKATFDAAWKVLKVEDKMTLLIQNLSILKDADFQQCFTDLGGEYKELIDRSRRHDAILTDNDNNQKLAKQLQRIGYLTSFNPEVKPMCSFPKCKIVETPIIRCRVKVCSK